MIQPDSLVMDFPTCKVAACSIIREDGTYLVVVNSRCGANKQRSSGKHELKHISSKDFEKEDADKIEASAHGNEL